MKELISRLIKNKRVAILGFGREGRSTYRYLRSSFPGKMINIIDDNSAILDDPEISGDPDVHLHLGNGSIKEVINYDIVFKAPGVPSHVFPANFDTSGITSQTSLFLEKFSPQVIGVTGTKGKSTTASLIHHIFSQSGFHSMLLGNIGLPPFEGIPDIRPETKIVMELSSHQLQYIRRSPHIAILLNIFQEHLDHYSSFEAYQAAKMNIGRYQCNDDFFIYCSDNNLLNELIQSGASLKHSCLPYSMGKIEGDGIYKEKGCVKMRLDNIEKCIYDSISGSNLPGEHNFLNIMAASAACSLAGVPVEKVNSGVNTFKGLEHRIEYVGKHEGVLYYNDSIATIPEAAIEAIKTLKIVDTLILGGYDRGIEYNIIYPFLQNSGIGNIIFIGEAGKRMKKEFTANCQSSIRIYDAQDYQEVVEIAARVTTKGKICLLSPAASSYDMFKNFEHRGNIFKKNVRNLGSSHF